MTALDLDPNMVTFLLDHPLARAIVYRMMRNAATTRDDPKMVSWYAPVEEAADEDAKRAALRKLISEAEPLIGTRR